MIRLILSFLFACLLNAQDSLYIKHLINVFTSESLKGRGYTFDGHIKASAFIKAQFKELEIKPYFEEYHQKFLVQSRIHTEIPELNTNKTQFKLGKEFLPFYSSGSGHLNNIMMVYHDFGVFEKNEDLARFKDKVVVFREKDPSGAQLPSVFERIMSYRYLNVKAIIVIRDSFQYGDDYGSFPFPVFQISEEAYLKMTNKLMNLRINNIGQHIETENIIGYYEGESDSTVIIMSHFDHLNAISEEIYFPGANDNASGISLNLEMAKFLKNKTLKHDILFIFFSGEEAGLLGSKHFINATSLDEMNIKFIINLDMVASGENGIMILGGTENRKAFSIFKSISNQFGLPPLRHRRNAPISDHFFFLNRGIDGFYIYALGGKQPYHSINDKPETLQFEKIYEIRTLVLEYLKHQHIWE